MPELGFFRAVVVDDEPLPRAHLVHLLREAGVGAVEEAGDAAECLALFARAALPPDWGFLDVRMPGLDGLALADALSGEDVGQAFRRPPPAVVFVTGYEDYAVAAFERAAVDYLLKPVERDRLAVTLQRLAGRTQDAPALPASLAGAFPSLQRLPIRGEFSISLLDIAEIVAAVAHNKRVEVLTPDAAHLTYYTLAQLEQRLPPERFLRVHDSWIINLADVAEIHNLGGQTYRLRLHRRSELVPVSRRRLPQLQARFGF